MGRGLWGVLGILILSFQILSSPAEASQRRVWKSVASEAEEQGEEKEVDFPVLDKDGDGVRDEVEILGGCASLPANAGLLLFGVASAFLRVRRRSASLSG